MRDAVWFLENVVAAGWKAAARSAPRDRSGARSEQYGTEPGIGHGGRGFAIPEALALYRLNALDAGVKGALEHGL